MKTKIVLISLILFSIYSCSKQKFQSGNLEEFYQIVGDDKSAVLRKAIDSFDNFLIQNYGNCKNQNLRSIAFLKSLRDNNYQPLDTWKFDNDNIRILLSEFEKSKLRHEIYLYGFEIWKISNDFEKKYKHLTREQRDTLYDESIPQIVFHHSNNLFINDSIEYDSTRYSRVMNIFIETMVQIGLTDSLTLNYIDARQSAGAMSTSTMVNGLLYNHEKYNYTDPFVKIILVTEFYYGIIKLYFAKHCKYKESA